MKMKPRKPQYTRSCQHGCFMKKMFSKNPQTHRKTPVSEPRACNLFKKETLAKVFSCELCEIFKEHLVYRTPLDNSFYYASTICLGVHCPLIWCDCLHNSASSLFLACYLILHLSYSWEWKNPSTSSKWQVDTACLITWGLNSLIHFALVLSKIS